MPASLPAGPTRFAIHNNGAVTHSFVIEGRGSRRRWPIVSNPVNRPFSTSTSPLAPTTIYCPIGEGAHRAKGMEVQLTVT